MHAGNTTGVGVSRAGDGAEGGAARIGIGGGDDAVTRIQLAARWAEAYSPRNGDSLQAMLQRFKTAYEYLDAVTHGIEPHAAEAAPGQGA